MMERQEKVLTHRFLLQQVWGPEYGEETEYVRIYVRQLRRKIEADPSHPRYLITEPGVGYLFREPSSERDGVKADGKQASIQKYGNPMVGVTVQKSTTGRHLVGD